MSSLVKDKEVTIAIMISDSKSSHFIEQCPGLYLAVAGVGNIPCKFPGEFLRHLIPP